MLPLGLRARGRPLALACCAALATLLLLAAGSLEARYFVGPFLWASMGVVSTPRDRITGLGTRALLAQGAVVATMAAYAAANLAPGSLTKEMRARVMRRLAHEARECEWLDKTLPPDAVIVSDIRSNALMPRRFLVADSLKYVHTGTGAQQGAQQLAETIRRRGATVAVTRQPPRVDLTRVRPVNQGRIADERQFSTATRNPWNRGQVYTRQIVVLGTPDR
jgi:hypothetical protein